MIETLNGIVETVNFKKSTSLKLYDNIQHEDYPSHWHPAIEIIMPLENDYYLHFPGSEETLRKGDICVICPGCIHSISAPSTGRRIIFQPNTSHLRFMSEMESLMSALYPYVIVTPEAFPSVYEEIRKLLVAIKDEYMSGRRLSEISIYGMLLQMLVLIGRNYNRDDNEDSDFRFKAQDENVLIFSQICDYIGDHCSEDLKLDEIAAMSGFSKFHFERLFKQFTGTSFYRYVNQKRISKAQELLIEPGTSVTDVAIRCGFSSISSFIRMFKIHKGCTPTEFRNMYYNVSIREEQDSAL